MELLPCTSIPLRSPALFMLLWGPIRGDGIAMVARRRRDVSTRLGRHRCLGYTAGNGHHCQRGVASVNRVNAWYKHARSLVIAKEVW
jgi:hypothetical protein